MEAAKKRIVTRLRKKARIAKTLRGSTSKPRVSVFRSAKHMYAQAIDDTNGVTLASLSTCQEQGADAGKFTGNKETAENLGKKFGAILKEKGISTVIFDRNGYIYHGRVKSLADGIREAGIEF